MVTLLKPQVKLILVGDYEQLPPIEPGNLMGEILYLKNSKFPITNLEIDCRRTKKGPLYNNIKCIAERNFSNLIWADDCLYFQGGMEFVEMCVNSFIHKIKNNKTNLEDIGLSITIISPFNTICEELNLRMRKYLNNYYISNKSGEQISVTDYYGKIWYLGDRIMMTDNRYDINVMNGEEGKVIKIVIHQ